MLEPVSPAAEAAHWFMLYHRTLAAEALADNDRGSAIKELDISEMFGDYIYKKASKAA